jgi:hypothetical protein
MPGVGADAFTDPDEYEASFRDVRVELVVTGRGQFRAAVSRAHFSQLHLTRSKEDLASIAYVALNPTPPATSLSPRSRPTPKTIRARCRTC